MKCPACGGELEETKTGDITVHACDGGCGGLWFDRLELEKVDLPTEAAGEALLHIARNPDVHVDVSGRRECPVDGAVMMQHFFSVKRKVTLDECPECAGVWLDAGELATIRSEYPTDEARKEAASKYFDEVFGDRLAAMHAKDAASAARAKKFAHLFRFICPSYYIPGKQEWGAF